MTEQKAHLARALRALGYKPESGIEDAVTRLMSQPKVAEMLLSYIDAGQPPMDRAGLTLAGFNDVLPGRFGFTTSSLARELDLSAAGCFLTAAELLRNPAAGDRVIIRIMEEGYWLELTPGVRAHRWPTASASLPSCPSCALRWVLNYNICPRCNYGQVEQELDGTEDDGPEPAMEPAWTAPAARDTENTMELYRSVELGTVRKPEPEHHGFCLKCGHVIGGEGRFCQYCGSTVKEEGVKEVRPGAAHQTATFMPEMEELLENDGLAAFRKAASGPSLLLRFRTAAMVLGLVVVVGIAAGGLYFALGPDKESQHAAVTAAPSPSTTPPAALVTMTPTPVRGRPGEIDQLAAVLQEARALAGQYASAKVPGNTSVSAWNFRSVEQDAEAVLDMIPPVPEPPDAELAKVTEQTRIVVGELAEAAGVMADYLDGKRSLAPPNPDWVTVSFETYEEACRELSQVEAELAEISAKYE